MIPHNQMAIWANRAAQKDLIEFRNLVVEYFNNASAGEFSDELQENETARRARRKINLMSNRVSRWAAATGHDSEVFYREAPMHGGRAYPIHMIANVFNLSKLRLEPRALADILENAIGVYQDDAARALVRTFNPLFWVGRLFDAVASLPFTLLGRIGFNQDKAEASVLGRIIKSALYLVQVAAAFLAVLDKLNLLDRFKHRLGL